MEQTKCFMTLFFIIIIFEGEELSMNEFEERKAEILNHKGKMVRHFKDKNYLILDFAIDSETEETLVIYKALYGDCKVYARNLDMFASEVDKNKYPNEDQKWRFELI